VLILGRHKVVVFRRCGVSIQFSFRLWISADSHPSKKCHRDHRKTDYDKLCCSEIHHLPITIQFDLVIMQKKKVDLRFTRIFEYF
jgi:hypothetical protein